MGRKIRDQEVGSPGRGAVARGAGGEKCDFGKNYPYEDAHHIV